MRKTIVAIVLFTMQTAHATPSCQWYGRIAEAVVIGFNEGYSEQQVQNIAAESSSGKLLPSQQGVVSAIVSTYYEYPQFRNWTQKQYGEHIRQTCEANGWY